MNRYRYRRRKHRAGRGMLALALVLSAVFLISCIAGSNPQWVRNVFGLDPAHYDREAVIGNARTDGSRAAELCEMVEILTQSGVKLESFDTPRDAVELYRDAILNDLLRDHYQLYNGNSAVLSAVPAAYPGTVISMLIPAEDFDRAASRYFGASSVRHKDGGVFEYLDRVDGYTAPVQAWEPGSEVLVESLAETENTWRMAFRLRDGERTSELYRAVFVKREDGSCYFYSLEQ